MGKHLKTTSERPQSGPVTPLQSPKVAGCSAADPGKKGGTAFIRPFPLYAGRVFNFTGNFMEIKG